MATLPAGPCVVLITCKHRPGVAVGSLIHVHIGVAYYDKPGLYAFHVAVIIPTADPDLLIRLVRRRLAGLAEPAEGSQLHHDVDTAYWLTQNQLDRLLDEFAELGRTLAPRQDISACIGTCVDCVIPFPLGLSGGVTPLNVDSVYRDGLAWRAWSWARRSPPDLVSDYYKRYQAAHSRHLSRDFFVSVCMRAGYTMEQLAWHRHN